MAAKSLSDDVVGMIVKMVELSPDESEINRACT